MEKIDTVLIRRIENVNVDNKFNNNVYDDVSYKVKDAIDKPKAIGEILSEKLNAPQNLRFYIKLAYLYSEETLFECLALTQEAFRDGLIRTTQAQYFYGIVKRRKKI